MAALQEVLGGKEFKPPIKQETKVATAEEIGNILKERIERVLKRTEDKPISFHPTSLFHRRHKEADLGIILSDDPYVSLETQETKDKFIEIKVDRETFAQVLSDLMKKYGASLDNWQVGGHWLWRGPTWEDRDYPTRYPHLVFRSGTRLTKEGTVDFSIWQIVCTKPSFSLL